MADCPAGACRRQRDLRGRGQPCRPRTPAGGGAGIEFWGSSFIADPQGIVLAEASAENEEILLAVVDTGHMEDVRRNWPFLRDRRIDAYGGITRRFLNDEPWSIAP